MYSLAVKPSVDRAFAKLSKKDKKQMEAVYKKIDEILINPQHYKNKILRPKGQAAGRCRNTTHVRIKIV